MARTHVEQLKGQLEEADRYADAAEYTLRPPSATTPRSKTSRVESQR
jgi:hypothetical protein